MKCSTRKPRAVAARKGPVAPPSRPAPLPIAQVRENLLKRDQCLTEARRCLAAGQHEQARILQRLAKEHGKSADDWTQLQKSQERKS